MAVSKTKIAQELTPEQLAAFCDALKDVPHGEMAAVIMEKAAALGIVIGKSAAYEFRNKVGIPWLERLQMRKEKAAIITSMGDDSSGKTLADAAAEELGQISFDLVTDLDGKINLATKEGRATFDVLTKGIERLRTGDRKMIKQLSEELRELREREEATKKDLNNNTLSAEDRAARMRARFGV